MIDKAAFIGSVAGKLQDLVSQGPGHPLKDDFEKNVKAILTNAFSKMELLTRDEFEGQAAVLRRTPSNLSKQVSLAVSIKSNI